MADPTITFNSGSGSDTAASGAGPATAVSGTAAAHTNGSASTTITLTNSPDLSGVATDGSAALWLKTTSGRQWSKITAVDDGADTVTVEDSFNIASGSAVDYAIGGKRATLDDSDSRQLLADMVVGWVVELEDDQSISSELDILGYCLIKSDSTTIRKITQSANEACIHLDSNEVFRMEYLKLENTNGTKTSANGLRRSVSNNKLVAVNCIFGDATNQLLRAMTGLTHATLYNCEITDCTSDGILYTDLIGACCWIHDNGGNGIEANTDDIVLVDSVIEGNTERGIFCRPFDTRLLRNCVIRDNTQSGLYLGLVAPSSTQPQRGVILDCQITENGGYGIEYRSPATDWSEHIHDFNNFGTGGTANTSGDTNESTLLGDNNINVDPQYADTGNNDYVGGANTQGAGSPGSGNNIGAGQTNTSPTNDIGFQQAAGGGDGSVIVRRNMMSQVIVEF